jgi:hypothetical protein
MAIQLTPEKIDKLAPLGDAEASRWRHFCLWRFGLGEDVFESMQAGVSFAHHELSIDEMTEVINDWRTEGWGWWALPLHDSSGSRFSKEVIAAREARKEYRWPKLRDLLHV